MNQPVIQLHQDELPTELLQQLLTLNKDATIIANDELQLLYWNPAADGLLAMNDAELFQQDLLNIALLPEQQASVRDHLIRLRLSHSDKEITLSVTCQGQQNKPFEAVLYARHITEQNQGYYLCVLHDNTDVARLNKSLEEISLNDSQTGLYKKEVLERIAVQEQDRARRYGTQPFLLLIGIDHLRFINNKYGDKGGDDILRSVGQLLLIKQRSNDVMGRLEGDLMAVILPDTTAPIAELVAENIRVVIEDLLTISNNQEIRVTASIGIAPMQAKQSYRFSLQEAQIALAQAKREGRNRYWRL